jgi:hypothetical protein
MLPRLALYPGGLILALAALLTWLDTRQARSATSITIPESGRTPHSALRTPHSALGRLALALAWLAAALLPLPGAAPLPLPPDLLVLMGLLLTAEAVLPAPLGNPAAFGTTALRAGALAALAASAGGLGLPLPPAPLLVALPAALAYGWGLAIAEGAGGREPGAGDQRLETEAHAIRSPFHVSRFTFHAIWLGWAGLGSGLLLMEGGALPAPWDMLLAGGALLGAAGLRRMPGLYAWAGRTQGIGWLALGVALVAALLAG